METETEQASPKRVGEAQRSPAPDHPTNQRFAPIRRRLLGLSERLGKPLALAFLRMSVGLTFAISGWGKLHSLDNVTKFFTTLKIPFPHEQAIFIAGLEFAGGIAIVLGLFTRIAAFLLSGTMVVAILTAKLPDLGKDFVDAGVVPTLTDKLKSFFSMNELLLLATFVVLMAVGPGVLSIDSFIGKAIGGDDPRPKPEGNSSS